MSFDFDQKYASVVLKFLFPDLVIYDLIQVHLARSLQIDYRLRALLVLLIAREFPRCARGEFWLIPDNDQDKYNIDTTLAYFWSESNGLFGESIFNLMRQET